MASTAKQRKLSDKYENEATKNVDFVGKVQIETHQSEGPRGPLKITFLVKQDGYCLGSKAKKDTASFK